MLWHAPADESGKVCGQLIGVKWLLEMRDGLEAVRLVGVASDQENRVVRPLNKNATLGRTAGAGRRSMTRPCTRPWRPSALPVPWPTPG